MNGDAKTETTEYQGEEIMISVMLHGAIAQQEISAESGVCSHVFFIYTKPPSSYRCCCCCSADCVYFCLSSKSLPGSSDVCGTVPCISIPLRRQLPLRTARKPIGLSPAQPRKLGRHCRYGRLNATDAPDSDVQ